MNLLTTFDSTKEALLDLLRSIKEGKTQLPDFQRGWVWVVGFGMMNIFGKISHANLSLRYCQTLSIGFISGLKAGIGIKITLADTLRLFALWNPPLSRKTKSKLAGSSSDNSSQHT